MLVGSHGSLSCYPWWSRQSDTLWVTVTRLWLHSLLCHLQRAVVEFCLQSHRYMISAFSCLWMRALTIYLKAASSHRVLSWYNCNQFIIKRGWHRMLQSCKWRYYPDRVLSWKVQVARVGVLTFCNLSNKPNLAAEMVDLGMLKVVQSLKLQAWNDEVNISLSLCLSFLTSFDKYYFSPIS